MKNRFLCTRRKFLLASLLSVSAPLYSSNAFASLSAESKYKDVTNGLISAFSNKKSLKHIGREYIKQLPASSSTSELVESILYSSSETVFHDSMLLNKKVLRKFIQDKVKEDFKQGRTISVQGWVLSQTEARLCGLAYLT